MQHKRVVRIMRGDNAGRTGEVYWSGRDMFGKPNLGVILEDGEKAYVPEKHTEPTTESPETTEQRRRALERRGLSSRKAHVFGARATLWFEYDESIIEGIKSLLGPDNRKYNKHDRSWTVKWTKPIEKYLLEEKGFVLVSENPNKPDDDPF